MRPIPAALYAAAMYARYKRRRAESKSVTYQSRSGTVSRRRRRLGRLRRGLSNPNFRDVVLRWQSTSDSYLGPGLNRIGTWFNAGGSAMYMPLHFMSLTNNAIIGEANGAKGCFKDQGMCQLFKSQTNNSFSWLKRVCQIPTGAGLSNSWQLEQGDLDPLSNVPDTSKYLYHDWTDIRMNLYGSFSVPLTYNIYVMTMKEQLDPFQFGLGADIAQGTECWNMFKDITRGCQGNSVSMNGRIDWPKDVRILKHDRIVMQPLGYSDQVAVSEPGPASHTPNIHEYRLFLNHRRYRNYKWSENADETSYGNNYAVNQWDVNVSGETMCDVEWGKRLFLIITCTCADVGEGTDDYTANAVTARVQGSYDICVRNKFRFISY